MHRLISMYSKNRLKVWAIIIMIILGLSLIQVLNKTAKERNLEKSAEKVNETKNENNINQVKEYSNESKSLVNKNSVPEKYKNELGDIIDDFYTSCINGDFESAYDLISGQCKNKLYPNEAIFEKLYCKEKFNGNKEYSFQSWDYTNDMYIYQVKIFDNMLETGKSLSQENIEEYITLISEGDSFKINLDSYLKTVRMEDKSGDDDLSIEAESKDIYMDYEIYKFNVKNNTDKTILLDTGKKTDTMYLVDSKENRYNAFSYEKSRMDLTIEPGQVKNIEIKYNRAFNNDSSLKYIVFSNIVKDEEFKQDSSIEGKTIVVNVVE